ncbi:expressed unknown protein [Seminavis robusta]|uniref:Uncharacterized protein n=1 Tax=Seminavis robusta TaxID=568900 RepID=A0A9N8E0W0_9STRA|nr:expressed unknown protein [Seminavis robusta]|eukprot:Sro508_g156770.1 n/a (194) ;mRNA; r:33719-34300
MKTTPLIATLLTMAAQMTTAFVSRMPTPTTRSKPLHMLPSTTETMLSHANNFWVATIDADIAKISDNEFAPIFAGGILVMFGGVISALIVGAILDSTNSYAEVIADSYAQSAEDEEFWKGLSEEERKKTQELLQKIKENKEGGAPAAAPAAVDTTIAEQATEAMSAQETTTAAAEPETAAPAKASDKSMFSDY